MTPTLVLLPGMDGTGDLFAPLIAALGGRVPIKIVRYPSTVPLDYAALEDFAHAALPQEGPFVLLGESFSGPIAVSLAARVPERLLGVILCCTFLRNPRPGLAFLRAGVGILPVTILPLRLFCHFLFGRFGSLSLREALKASLAQVLPSVLRARLLAVLTVDVTDKLATLKVPVLCLQGARDRIVPASACPAATTVSLEAPHALLQVIPEEAARVIEDFIGSRGLPPREGTQEPSATLRPNPCFKTLTL